MAFIRKKTIKRKYKTYGGWSNYRATQQLRSRGVKTEQTTKPYDYYYLVENVRENGKVKQRTILSLGHCSTVAAAIANLNQSAELYRKYAASALERINRPRFPRDHLRRKKEVLAAMAIKCTQKAGGLERQIETLKPYL